MNKVCLARRADKMFETKKFNTPVATEKCTSRHLHEKSAYRTLGIPKLPVPPSGDGKEIHRTIR
jgi:hypothetical protein